ncbi:unnamed protein product, partial [Prorocentrum cordatum]
MASSSGGSRSMVLPTALPPRAPRRTGQRAMCGGHPPGGKPGQQRSAGSGVDGPDAAPLAALAPVTLHLYDVTGSGAVRHLNGLFTRAGMGVGAFHAGVEIFQREWSFGFCEGGGSGVFDCQPRGCSVHTYRESIDIGSCGADEDTVLALISELSAEWSGEDYDLIRRNCCHFCARLAELLGAGPIPQRVLSLAAAGAAVDDGVHAVLSGADQITTEAIAGAGQLDSRYRVTATAGELAAGALAKASTLDEQYRVRATAGALASEAWAGAEKLEEEYHVVSGTGALAADAADRATALVAGAIQRACAEASDIDERYQVTQMAGQLASGLVTRVGSLDEDYLVSGLVSSAVDRLGLAAAQVAEQAPLWMEQAMQLSAAPPTQRCSMQPA